MSCWTIFRNRLALATAVAALRMKTEGADMSGFIRRALSLAAALLLLTALGAQSAGAVPAASVGGPHRIALRSGDPQRRATLSRRRAEVRGELAAAVDTGQLMQQHPKLTIRHLTTAQQRALDGAAAGSGAVRGRGGRLNPATLRTAEAGSCLPCGCGTGTSACSADFVAAGPGGPLDWNIYSGEPALPGYPSLTGYVDGATVSGAETVKATAAIYTNSTSNQQVHVTWQVICLGSQDTYDLGQVVTAPPWTGTTQGAVVSFTFQVPSPGSAACQPGLLAAGGEIDFGVNAEIVGSDSSDLQLLPSDLAAVPAAQEYGCPASPDSAGAPLVQGFCGDPVNTASGEFADTFTDATLQTPGYPLSITRSYSSAVTATGAMGPGWSLPWQAGLAVQGNGDVIFTAENGDQYTYTSNGNGSFTPPPGVRSVLAAVTSGTTVTGYTLTAPDHHVLTFSAGGQLQSVKDATGRGVTLGYTGGEVTSLTDAAGQTASLSYTSGLLTKITLPKASTIAYGYSNGRLTSATVPGGSSGYKTTYAYNSAGLLDSIQDPDGNFTVRNTYNSSGQVTSQQDGTGATTTFSYTRTSGGLPETDVTDPDGGISTDVYEGGMLLQSVDPMGGVTSYGYNGFFEPTTVTDPLGHITTMGYDSNGNMTSLTDPLGHEQQWAYDSSNDLTSYTDADGNTTSYTYNSMHEVTSETSPSGGKTTYSYDSAGNLTSSVDPRGNVSGGDPASYTTTYTYNPSGQLASETNPDGDKTSYTYDSMGYPLTVTDPEGHVTSYAYDGDERLTSVTAPDGGVTRYAYDGAGNLTARTDPDGNTWTYAYDADNRLTKITDPLGNSVTYGYDGDGNQVSYTDARKIVTTTSYDADNRPVKITYSDGTPTVTYAYDADGNITKITDATGTRTLSYDAAGNLTKAAGPGSGSFSYAYDAAGNITTRTYPDGTSLVYGYNSAEQVTSMTDGSAKTTYAYDAAGNLTSTALPDGITETRGYDNAGQLTSITDKHGSVTLDADALTLNADGQPAKAATTENGTAQPAWYYAYDAAGQLASACQTSAAASACSTASGGGETAWTYDKAGNMLTQAGGGTTTSYTHNAAEQLTKATTGTTAVSYGYDADGDLITAGTSTYAYNGAGELDKAVTTAGTYTYSYDAAGNLYGASDNGTLKQTTIWDLNNPLPLAAEQTSSTGATTADLLYNPNGTLNAMSTAAGTYDATTDWLGSVTGLVSSAGTQVASTAYSPYGTPTSTGTPASPIGYAGSYTLPGSGGLDDMRARDYHPATATFTSADPLQAQTGQPYAYADDDPVTQTDPTGTITCPGWIPGCGVITNIQNKISGLARAWWNQWWVNNPCNSGYQAAALTPYELAQAVAQATGGTVEETTGAGYKVLVPYGSRGIMVRVMQANQDYPDGYWRISIPGKQAFTIEGEASVDKALTHVGIGDNSLEDILEVIAGITGE